MSTKEEVLGSLHGQSYRIRGLTSALPADWPHAMHPDYEEAKPVVDELIEKYALMSCRPPSLPLASPVTQVAYSCSTY